MITRVSIWIDNEHGQILAWVPEVYNGKKSKAKKVEVNGHEVELFAGMWVRYADREEFAEKLKQYYPNLDIEFFFKFMEQSEVLLVPVAQRVKEILKTNPLYGGTSASAIVAFNGAEIAAYGLEFRDRSFLWFWPPYFNKIFWSGKLEDT